MKKAPAAERAEYRLQDGMYGVYVGEYCAFETEEVALLMNMQGHLVVKHGHPDDIHAYYAKLVRCGTSAAVAPDKRPTELLNRLEVIQGRFDVDQLNRVLRGEESGRSLYAQAELAAARGASEVLAQVMAM
jgi:hypothetical protein